MLGTENGVERPSLSPRRMYGEVVRKLNIVASETVEEGGLTWPGPGWRRWAVDCRADRGDYRDE